MRLQQQDEYHEDMGDVIWFHFDGFEEPFEVYFGSALETDFDFEYWTHFAQVDSNDLIQQAEALQ